MKKTILLTLMLIVVASGFSQPPVTRSYSYDAAGNRTSRTTITIRQAVATETDTILSETSHPKQETGYEELVGESHVKIYPNPTKGLITLQFDNPVYGSYQLTDLSGKMLSEGSISAAMVTIDLFQYRNGVYLLALTINGKTEIWKIIKH